MLIGWFCSPASLIMADVESMTFVRFPLNHDQGWKYGIFSCAVIFRDERKMTRQGIGLSVSKFQMTGHWAKKSGHDR